MDSPSLEIKEREVQSSMRKGYLKDFKAKVAIESVRGEKRLRNY